MRGEGGGFTVENMEGSGGEEQEEVGGKGGGRARLGSFSNHSPNPRSWRRGF